MNSISKLFRGNTRWLTFGILCLVAVILFIIATISMENGTPIPSSTPTGGQAVPGPAGLTLPQSYADAVAEHDARGTRFQFDQYCQAIPRQASVKNGSSIMLDNRSGDARTIRVGTTAYSVAGYGWRIVTVRAATVPATIYFDCGSARNVGTLYLQP